MIEVITPFAALVAGLLGSGHCVMMCGGIAGALGYGSAAASCTGASLRFPLLYNLGRVTSYTAAGAVVGAAGSGLAAIGGGPTLRSVLAAAAALVIVVAGLRLAAGSRSFGGFERAGRAIWRRIAPLTRTFLPVTTPGRAFGIGLVWGWLPCGMAYAMLAAAALTGGAWQGATLMALFGIGTLPAMLTLGAGATQLLGPRTRRLGGAVLILLGLASGAAAIATGDAGHVDHAAHAHMRVDAGELPVSPR
jgi:uncharacterized protein